MTWQDEHLLSLHNINKVAAFVLGFILLELSNNLFPTRFWIALTFAAQFFSSSPRTLLIYQLCQLSPHHASKHNVKYAEEYTIINAY